MPNEIIDALANALGSRIGQTANFFGGSAEQLGNAALAPGRFAGGVLRNVGQGIGNQIFPQSPQNTPLPPLEPTEVVRARAAQQLANKPPVPESVPQQETQQGSVNDKKKSLMLEFLKRAGVPLGAAIAGSVNPNLAAGAAGLAQGYNQGFNRQEELGLQSEEVPLIAEQEDGSFKEIGRFPKNAKFSFKREDGSLGNISIIGTDKDGLPIISTGENVQSGTESVQEKLKEFESEAAARKAGFGKGDKVIINGQSGTLN